MKLLLFSAILALAFAAAQARFFDFFRGTKENYNFEKLPNHKNYTLMARFIVHNVDWTAVSYKSFEKDTLNLPMATIFSTGDGTMANGNGVPYFYLTEAEPSVKGLMRNDSRCGLMMSLVQTKICGENKWDAEDPRCARVFLYGKVQALAEKTPEYDYAKKTFEARHPNFVGMPGNHNFFFAKYVIDGIKLISGVGGVRVVAVKDYLSAKDSTFNLTPYEF